MTLSHIRQAYLKERGIWPDSIPGRRCLAGDWDHAPALRERIEAQREAA